jgi:ribose 5-phosphate isomerase A
MANLKKLAGDRAAEFVKSGMIVGLGSGSTAAYAVIRIGEMVRDGLLTDIVGIPTSDSTAKLAEGWNIPLTTLHDQPHIDLTIDGADEIDPQLNLIKGGGGALLREKIVAHASRQEIIVADQTKLVERLGQGFLLPVEVIPFGWNICAADLAKLGCPPRLRMQGDMPYVTDEGNYILDCELPPVDDLKALECKINLIPGVVENGLFLGYTDLVVVGIPTGTRLMGSLDS